MADQRKHHINPYSFDENTRSIYSRDNSLLFGRDFPLFQGGEESIIESIRRDLISRVTDSIRPFSGFDIEGSVDIPEDWGNDDFEKSLEGLNDYQRRQAISNARRNAIIERTRNAPLSNEYYHEGRPAPSITDPGKKRVAAYTRVSTRTQISSAENQEKFYQQKVNSTDNWELVRVYSDKGISGVDIKKRKAFQQMLRDAAKGDFDYILCMSVSRFSRNITQCIDAVNRLKNANSRKPVGVFFETENIFTLSRDSMQAFGVHALLAHWESENKSKRMILSMDQRIMIGQYQIVDLFGYRHNWKGELVVQTEEATVFRFIVLSLIDGTSATEIAKMLTERGKKTLTGRTIWTSGTLGGLLGNERRWGDLEARKTICYDYIEKKTMKNNGQRDWAYVPNHHQGIATEDEVRAARMMLSAAGMLENGMPELRVIAEGALKGFVSIRPRWSGIDTQVLYNACLSVYSDEEVEEIERELRIWNGEEDDNVVDMMLWQFKVAPSMKIMNSGTPSVTIKRRSISFSSSCQKRMNCEWVELLYHPLRHLLVIREGDSKDPNSFHWMKEGKTVGTAEAGAFSTCLYESLHWKTDYEYRFKGISREREGQKIMIFSVDEPLILETAKTKREKEEAMAAGVRHPAESLYVNYKTDDEEYNDRMDRLRYRNIALNQQQVISPITGQDIQGRSVVLHNPLVGKVGTRQEREDELERLFAAM